MTAVTFAALAGLTVGYAAGLATLFLLIMPRVESSRPSSLPRRAK